MLSNILFVCRNMASSPLSTEFESSKRQKTSRQHFRRLQRLEGRSHQANHTGRSKTFPDQAVFLFLLLGAPWLFGEDALARRPSLSSSIHEAWIYKCKVHKKSSQKPTQTFKKKNAPQVFRAQRKNRLGTLSHRRLLKEQALNERISPFNVGNFSLPGFPFKIQNSNRVLQKRLIVSLFWHSPISLRASPPFSRMKNRIT